MPCDIDYSRLPAHMQAPTRQYIEQHAPVGGFLMAVLSNDLVQACCRADSVNFAALAAWAQWLYNECPSPAWGSPEKVRAWLATAPGSVTA